MDHREYSNLLNRRGFLRECACGIGMAAVADLLRTEGLLAAEPVPLNPLAPKPPQFPAKAKSVIFLLMDGGPSQVDLFDPKPELNKHQGEPLPPSVAKNLHL